MRTALITGVNGQDGSYLAEFLLGKSYRVVGTVRNATGNLDRIAHFRESIDIVELDLTDASSLEHLIQESKPDEIYNLAARASSSELWTEPILTGEVNALSVTRLLQAIRNCRRDIRFCQASSSEIFGNAPNAPQDESTPLRPRNPYGAAKTYAHWITTNYREGYGLFAGSAILFNHESPRRDLEFVTRKISNTVARIKLGRASALHLGSLDARRDWGFAGDYVRAMWLMLQQPKPADFVVATGETHSVGEFCKLAFARVGLDHEDYVVQDCDDLRPPESLQLVGNPAAAKRELGWKPTVTFQELVWMMVDADLELLNNSSGEGLQTTRSAR
jgi:GDPmannose 4,6-dehydratase